VECFDTIETVKAATDAFHTPKVQCVAKKIFDSSDSILLHNVFPRTQKSHSSSRATVGNEVMQQGKFQYTKACVQPGLDHFKNTYINSSFKDALSWQIFLPQPNAKAADARCVFWHCSTFFKDLPVSSFMSHSCLLIVDLTVTCDGFLSKCALIVAALITRCFSNGS